MERLTERNPSWIDDEMWERACEPDCEEIDAVYRKLKAYEDAEEQGQQGKWIPVSERLPEKSGEYLTWVRYNNEEFMSIEEIDCEGILKKWNFTGEVLAWMPLPEPYRESEEENGK